MTIYVDVVIFDNVVVDGVLLYLSSALLKNKCKWWRALLGGLVGASCAFASVFFHGYAQTLVKLAFVAPMCLVANGKRRLLWHVVLFVSFTFACGGLVLGLFELFGVEYSTEGMGLTYESTLPLFVVALGVVATVVSCKALFKFVRSFRVAAAHEVSAKLLLGDAAIDVVAFCDSGNSLESNGLPVCFVVGRLKKRVAEQFSQALLCGKTVTVDFSTMDGGAKSLAMEGEVEIGNVRRKVLVALPKSGNGAQFDLLLNNQFSEDIYETFQRGAKTS